MTPTEIALMLGELSRACQLQMFAEGVFKRDLESLLSRLEEYGLVVQVRVGLSRNNKDMETIAVYGGKNRDTADFLGSNNG